MSFFTQSVWKQSYCSSFVSSNCEKRLSIKTDCDLTYEKQSGRIDLEELLRRDKK